MKQSYTNIYIGGAQTPCFRPLGYPMWLRNQLFATFIVAFFLCSVIFGHVMEFRYAIVSVLSVAIFCFGGYHFYKSNSRVGEKIFVKHLVLLGILLRFIWVGYCYFYFNEDYYGQKLGDPSDTEWYMDYGKSLAEWVTGGFQSSFETVQRTNAAAIDDTGYPIWLAIIYLLFGIGNDVFIPMVVKCIVSAFCAILVYRIGQRHFGEQVGRLAGIFVALNPNMIYWCGTMFKEPEMVFLCCLYVNEMDKALGRNSNLTFKALLPATLIGLYLFLFRSALGLVAFMAMFAHIVLASQKIISVGKKIIAGLMVAVVLLVGMGDSLRSQAKAVAETVTSDQQKKNMEWRSTQKNGNEFAKYAGAAVFAPLIFTIPFPTFNVANESQILQLELSGGNFIKNVFSFFVILSMFVLLFSGEWRRHVFILAYICGYLACLVLSNFAQSSRFHMPIWPMLMLFAAFGLSLVLQNRKWKRWWPMVLAAEVVICLGWNWFKLKGRGMI